MPPTGRPTRPAPQPTRLFVANDTGTGGYIQNDLDPPYEQDENGNDITFELIDDSFRPNCVIPDGVTVKTTRIRFRQQWKWICWAYPMAAAPAQTYDVGDPTDPAFLASEPSNPERRALETQMGMANRELDGLNWEQCLQIVLEEIGSWGGTGDRQDGGARSFRIGKKPHVSVRAGQIP